MIIGVLPSAFHLPMIGGYAGLWVPARFSAEEIRTGGADLTVIGRLKGEATLAQAQAEAEVINANLRQTPSVLEDGEALRVKRLTRFVGNTGHVVWIMSSVAAGFVLLIACANVSGLLLARALSRSREMVGGISFGDGHQ